ncbi:MAG: filamentous hemagglutinin N-terminal domain-containing protein, partial [Methanosarcinaceae archaeon]|nr:filamentous hemagglutinin N-terminal domain-containing protein [Methanosarcinaceae archaeon]
MVLNTSLPAALAEFVPPDSGALPSGGSVPTGYGSVGEFDYAITGELHVRDIADQTVINWDSFDIGSAALTEFHQNSINSAVLNRIMSGEASGIFGSLQANGRVFIVNPAGIVFGANSTVNVTQLVASTLNITDENFWNGNGNYEFAGDIDGVDVQERLGVINNSDVLHGIHAAEGVALIGKKILNAGTITTNEGGIVVMAAGDRVLLG